MTGAVLALVGAVAAGGGAGPGGGGTLGPLTWADIYGDYTANNTALTVTGITSFHSLTASRTGAAALYYVLNGTRLAYAGAFNVNAADTLGWQVVNNVRNTFKSGTVTVNDASNGGALVSTFNYSVSDNVS